MSFEFETMQLWFCLRSDNEIYSILPWHFETVELLVLFVKGVKVVEYENKHMTFNVVYLAHHLRNNENVDLRYIYIQIFL